jgi:septal ring factor EnvC (AmiA/AmiB activator)
VNNPCTFALRVSAIAMAVFLWTAVAAAQENATTNPGEDAAARELSTQVRELRSMLEQMRAENAESRAEMRELRQELKDTRNLLDPLVASVGHSSDTLTPAGQGSSNAPIGAVAADAGWETGCRGWKNRSSCWDRKSTSSIRRR